VSGALPRERPSWLKVRAPSGKMVSRVEEVLRKNGLVTVCREARCPNVGECWGEGTATVLLLGDVCSRGCAFCNVTRGRPAPPDPSEPEKIAAASAELRWKHVVVTSVTRDDLADGGAAHFARVVEVLRSLPSPPAVELLVPDFAGDRDALAMVVRSRPDILAHNVETVPRLYSRVRPRASYERSLALLSRAHAIAPGLALKSGLMVGFGETEREVVAVMEDLHRAGCRSVTVGQYLPPSRIHAPVTKYYSVEEFGNLGEAAHQIGFDRVASGPLVRSSYKAAGES
jgi:lipoic acid synthetase